MTKHPHNLIARALELDVNDPLSAFRSHFHIPKHTDGSDQIYLCGNSLGLQPKSTGKIIQEILTDWSNLAVEAHFKANHPWMSYHELVTDSLAHIVGAMPSEVVAMNTLTVNLHLLMVSFYRPTPERHKIIIEGGAFPSDQYAVKSQIQFHSFNPGHSLIELKPRPGEDCLRTEDILATIEHAGDQLALVMLGGVNYLTGQAYDMASITTAGHKAGAVVGFDLAHAAGNIPLKLHDWDVDFAVWCSYKYLNASPGGIAGAFVHERHHTISRHSGFRRNPSLSRFAGWWGHDKSTRFKMPPDFRPIAGAEGWQLSNPAILPLAALRASLDEFDAASMDQLRAKSVKLTSYLWDLLHTADIPGLHVVTPADQAQRGAQLSISIHGMGRQVHERLTAAGVISDWREPDVIRVAPVPLYNSYSDVQKFVTILKELVQ